MRQEHKALFNQLLIEGFFDEVFAGIKEQYLNDIYIINDLDERLKVLNRLDALKDLQFTFKNILED